MLTDRKVGLASRWSPDGKTILTECGWIALARAGRWWATQPDQDRRRPAVTATRGAWSPDAPSAGWSPRVRSSWRSCSRSGPIRDGVIRPNVFLVLLTMLAVVALVVSIHNEFLLGSTFRACRLIGFMAVLWLLTPWWGRSDFVLLRSHITCLRIVLGTVLVGAVLAPGAAFSYDGRLTGRTVADTPDAGGPLRSRSARVHRRAVVRWRRYAVEPPC